MPDLATKVPSAHVAEKKKKRTKAAKIAENIPLSLKHCKFIAASNCKLKDFCLYAYMVLVVHEWCKNLSNFDPLYSTRNSHAQRK